MNYTQWTQAPRVNDVILLSMKNRRKLQSNNHAITLKGGRNDFINNRS